MYSLSAINSGVKDIREVITKAKEGNLFQQKRPLLFIDEIHRFSKSQQDSLLGAVEDGTITLIGATTENPSFEVISALLSRAQVYTLKPLDKTQLDQLLENALSHDDWLKKKNIKLAEKEALMRFSGGDARKLLNILELIANNESGSEIIITNEMVQEKLQDKLALYDKNGEQHYDIISAFIKSIRGSDPNGAVYWLARMIEGGEDIKFIARRLVILASEDIGNANPTALVMANAAFDAVSKIGFPEGRIILAQCTTYLASSAKSNASYEAINLAQQAVRDHGDLEVPLHIRNAPTKLMKELGYGKEYAYSHSYEGNFKAQEYLPEKLSGTRFYSPGNNDRENALRRSLKQKWQNKYGY
jgi:putative ATPase